MSKCWLGGGDDRSGKRDAASMWSRSMRGRLARSVGAKTEISQPPIVPYSNMSHATRYALLDSPAKKSVAYSRSASWALERSKREVTCSLNSNNTSLILPSSAG